MNPYDLPAPAAPRAPAHGRGQKDAAAQPHCNCTLRKDGQIHPTAELLPQACSPPRFMGGHPTSQHLDFGEKSQASYLKRDQFKQQNESKFVPILLHFRLGGRTLLIRSSSQGKNIPTKPFHFHGEKRVPPPSMT